MTTIRDVAEHAGVSLSTASLAFNHPARVAEATRARILESARLLGYRPNGLARDLRVRRTQTVALLLHDLGGPFYSELIGAVDETAAANGYTLIVARAVGRENRTLSRLLDNRVDGAVVLDSTVPDAALVARAGPDLPMVALDRLLVTEHISSVTCDNYGGGLAVARHLLAGGYRRLAFLAGPGASRDSRLRWEGFAAGLKEAGIDPGSVLRGSGEFKETGGYQTVKAWLSAGLTFEALFAANDEMALGALAALMEGGLRVPEDVALVGFDDIRLARYVQPALTTVRQPMPDLGREAMRLLLEALSGEGPARKRILPTELIVRGSAPLHTRTGPRTGS